MEPIPTGIEGCAWQKGVLMADTLKFEIVTPEGTVVSDQVQMVTLPTVEGQMGVLPHHVRLMTQVVPGEVAVRTVGREAFFAIGGGLVEVAGDHVTVVT